MGHPDNSPQPILPFMCRKNGKLKYVWCCERTAEFLDLDSPAQIIGKTDLDLPSWAKHSDLFEARDAVILRGSHQNNLLEPQDREDGIKMSLVSKNPIYTRNGSIDGVFCTFAPVSDPSRFHRHTAHILKGGKLCLGTAYNNAILSPREHQILLLILQGTKPAVTQKNLQISRSTYDSTVKNIKHKMSCDTIGDIIYSAIQTQLISVILSHAP